MTDLFPVTIAEQIAEVHREVELRRRVYPGWIERGKMRQATADNHMRRMEAVLNTLRRLRDTE